MTSVQEDYNDPQEFFTDEDNHFFPRCSTPIIDPLAVCRPQENRSTKIYEKSKKYSAWKNRLERKKYSRNFKLRGVENIPQLWLLTNSTIISGYFEPELSDQISQESILRPEPVYQNVWVPISYPFLAPTANNCYHHDNQAFWYKLPVQQQLPSPQFQSAQVFGASGGAAFFNMINNGHYNHNLQYEHQHHHESNYFGGTTQLMQCNTHYPQPQMTMGHFHYQYHHPSQFYTYSSETQRPMNYVNGIFHEGNGFPITMTS